MLQKEQITKSFINGDSVESLSQKFNYSKLTIIRNLKTLIGDEKYKIFNKVNNSPINKNNVIPNQINNQSNKTVNDALSDIGDSSNNSLLENKLFTEAPFVEITPLNYEIDSLPQRDLASIPLNEIEFPKIVYMIVDKDIELEVKLLKDYPEWDFLSNDDLNRKTIVIYNDLKVTKSLCKKDDKVIKFPNTNVFRIAAPLLNARGISRIIFNDKLIAL